MDENGSGAPTDCDRYRPAREYTWFQVCVDNLPYACMLAIGAVVLYVSCDATALALSAALAYVAYGLAGAFWIMLFVCPYCHFYATRACPCGYGVVAARLRPAQDGERFREKFKAHIPVIVPLWFIPLLAGGLALRSGFSVPLASLLGAFALDAFVILPLVSRIYGCAHCSQKDSCPWMKAPAAETGD